MIADVLAQSSRYACLHPQFAMAFEFLKQLPADLSIGRHDLDGDRCFALVQTYTAKPANKAAFEAHKKYIDIQFIQSGRETILWAPLATLTQVTQPYVEERDVMFFATPPQVTPVNLHAGDFTIFFPEDGHAPGIEYAVAAEIRKVVIKIRA